MWSTPEPSKCSNEADFLFACQNWTQWDQPRTVPLVLHAVPCFRWLVGPSTKGLGADALLFFTDVNTDQVKEAHQARGALSGSSTGKTSALAWHKPVYSRARMQKSSLKKHPADWLATPRASKQGKTPPNIK